MTVHKSAETIQGRKLFKGGNYSRKYGSCNSLKISYLAAECAEILRVLGDFHLFDGFTEGSTITGSIFTNNSDLLGAFSLENLTRETFKTQIHHNYHGRSSLKSFTNTNPFNLDVFE